MNPDFLHPLSVIKLCKTYLTWPNSIKKKKSPTEKQHSERRRGISDDRIFQQVISREWALVSGRAHKQPFVW